MRIGCFPLLNDHSVCAIGSGGAGRRAAASRPSHASARAVLRRAPRAGGGRRPPSRRAVRRPRPRESGRRAAAAASSAPAFASLPRDAAALSLTYPSTPGGVCAPQGVFAAAVHWAEETGAVVVHDLAYADLVFDGHEPQSFLAAPGAKEVGVELYSMSKTYGMAGWRLGFVVGNGEVVARINLLTTHVRSGGFTPVQEAGVAALAGPQGSVEERRARYEARRDRVAAATGARSEGTFF